MSIYSIFLHDVSSNLINGNWLILLLEIKKMFFNFYCKLIEYYDNNYYIRNFIQFSFFLKEKICILYEIMLLLRLAWKKDKWIYRNCAVAHIFINAGKLNSFVNNYENEDVSQFSLMDLAWHHRGIVSLNQQCEQI